MNNRLNLLRKTLGLTQNELGLKLGVTSSSISKLEKGSTKFTEQMIKTICREFNVNENWLRYGTGEMFIENDGLLEKCLKENNATESDIKLIKCYLNLDLDIRNKIHKHFESYFNDI
ncbi:MAG: helix-turn-helix transcriptional regulator [uncultured Clostridium sp.]